ncbi:hypothetical protein [Streptomyces sp. TLI_171]|uniref:hypothetical protein n=1 Tax=Streptomyces sp. TLI_171 TaxID=1938859 RepID=UPI0011814EF5|nr:hypothetical protein [Streptomyces sp. TLI_171]
MAERRIPGHARSGLKHWVLVAAGCAAVVGGALGASSATGAVTSGQGPAVEPAPEVDVSKVTLPMDCGPFLSAVSLKAAAKVDGHAVTVVAAHCQADMGTPPDAVFLLRGDSPKPVPLLTEADGYTLTELAIRSDGSIRGKARGYSSDDVPRFSPDLQVELTWTQGGGGWTKAETKTPVHTA